MDPTTHRSSDGRDVLGRVENLGVFRVRKSVTECIQVRALGLSDETISFAGAPGSVFYLRPAGTDVPGGFERAARNCDRFETLIVDVGIGFRKAGMERGSLQTAGPSLRPSQADPDQQPIFSELGEDLQANRLTTEQRAIGLVHHSFSPRRRKACMSYRIGERQGQIAA